MDSLVREFWSVAAVSVVFIWGIAKQAGAIVKAVQRW